MGVGAGGGGMGRGVELEREYWQKYFSRWTQIPLPKDTNAKSLSIIFFSGGRKDVMETFTCISGE